MLEDDARLFLQNRNSIDGKVLTLINHYEFVKELMDYLEFVYSGKGNISRIFDVCRAFYHSEKQDRSLTELFMHYKKTYEQLDVLLLFSLDVKVQQGVLYGSNIIKINIPKSTSEMEKITKVVRVL